MESSWGPHGVHVESSWSPSECMWSPCGVLISPGGVTLCWMGPCGVLMESTWTPRGVNPVEGVHVESKWNMGGSVKTSSLLSFLETGLIRGEC